jgi:hypothetical protein
VRHGPRPSCSRSARSAGAGKPAVAPPETSLFHHLSTPRAKSGPTGSNQHNIDRTHRGRPIREGPDTPALKSCAEHPPPTPNWSLHPHLRERRSSAARDGQHASWVDWSGRSDAAHRESAEADRALQRGPEPLGASPSSPNGLSGVDALPAIGYSPSSLSPCVAFSSGIQSGLALSS